jgi:8-oxo-dGTP pyrophosphatase MutT (NUDIX family)
MLNEVSIYFEKRKIVLTENVESHFNKQFGLFTHYSTPQELSKILEFFQTTPDVQNVFISGKDFQTMIDEFSCMFRVVEASGGLVQNSNGEYLFIFRYGKWDLPKGKLEPDEKIEDAAVREVSEETGISNIKLSDHIFDTFHTYRLGNATILKKTHWFSMRYDGTEPLIPQESEDISVAKWVSENQIKEVLKNTYDTIFEVLAKAGVVSF